MTDYKALLTLARMFDSALLFAATMAGTGRYSSHNLRGRGDGFRELAAVWYRANTETGA